MPTLRNITCNVQIDGKALETISEEVCGHIYEGYIIVESGKPYTLNFEFGKTGSPRHCIWVQVDGQIVNSASCEEKEIEIAGSRYGLNTYHGQMAWEYRHLEFKNILEIGNPKYPERNLNRIQNVGKIRVIIRRQHGETVVTDYEPTANPESYRTFLPLRAIPKSEIKRRHISHGTHISQEVSEFYDASKSSNPKDVERHDHVVFVFNYASREMLRKMGVLPPEQMSIDDDLVGMSMDTLQQEVMKLRTKKKWTFSRIWSTKKIEEEEGKPTGLVVEGKDKNNIQSKESLNSGSEISAISAEGKKGRSKRLLCF
ncbi:hypothetical protein TWF718_007888 [Orbilia javanica]|uniref:DUF7918 domain-containing protein n=1 Tax=Orbilia javanica TaxID=47235 RepID=A0AAN8MMB6_9PEZI